MCHPSVEAADHRNQHTLKMVQPWKPRPRGGTLWEIASRKINIEKKEIVVVVLERNKLKQKNG